MLHQLAEDACISDANCTHDNDTSSERVPAEPRTCSLTVQSAAQSLSLCVRPAATAATADDVRKLLGGCRGGGKRRGGGSRSTTTTPPPPVVPIEP